MERPIVWPGKYAGLPSKKLTNCTMENADQTSDAHESAEPDAVESTDLRSALMRIIDQGQLPTVPDHPCPYLPGLEAAEEAFMIDRLDAEIYHDLMDIGFRRSGDYFYRPKCSACKACVPLRVPVDSFVPSKSQRRILRRNVDVNCEFAEPDLTDQKLDLYQRYLERQHPGSKQSQDPTGLENFLYSPSVDSLEALYTIDDRLVAVSIVDLCSRSMSSVYHYFDPDEAERSLGVFSVLAEIQWCQQRKIPHYYMGYWVKGASTMEYKANYRPHELLVDGKWISEQ